MAKLTVLMPVYNGERFLRQAIASVLNQTFGDYEFLIIDDKSVDGSRDVILSYKDGRIRFVQNRENLGQTRVLNLGVDLAGGEYIARMDQDDISLPERFAKEVEMLDRAGDLGLVYSDSFIIDENGTRRAKTMFDLARPMRSRVFDALIKQSFIPGNTVMARKQVYHDVGFYNPAYTIAAEYELYLRVSSKYTVDFIADQLAEYRVHGGNASANIEKSANEALEILKALRRTSCMDGKKSILDKKISYYTAVLGANALFSGDRRLCRRKSLEALRIDPMNAKAAAAIIMAVFFPGAALKGAALLRKKRMG